MLCRLDVRRAASNLGWVNVLPPENVNVYSILQQGHLIVSQDALSDIITKLHTPIFRGPIDRARWKAKQEKLLAEKELPQAKEKTVNTSAAHAEAPAVTV